jgi:type IV pilus assembly protein PilB
MRDDHFGEGGSKAGGRILPYWGIGIIFMDRRQKRLGEILIEDGRITAEQLKAALEEQILTKEFLGKILLKRKLLTERVLLKVLSEQFSLPVADLGNCYFDWKLVKSFSPSLILDYHCFVIAKDDLTVTMAITNPLDVWVIKKAEEEARGLKLKLVLVSEEDMREAIEKYRQYIQKNIPDFR